MPIINYMLYIIHICCVANRPSDVTCYIVVHVSYKGKKCTETRGTGSSLHDVIVNVKTRRRRRTFHAVRMSRRKGRGVLCFRGGQDEGDGRDADVVAGEYTRRETELLKSMMAQFEGKLDRLMMSSDRERQLTDLIRDSSVDLQQENSQLKEENKMLVETNRETERRLILAESDCRNLANQHATTKEIVRALNDRLRDVTGMVDQQREEKADLQSELKSLKDKTNSLMSELAAMGDLKSKWEKQQEELLKEKQQLQLLLVKKDELNQNRLRMAWMRFHEMKEERDSAVDSFSKNAHHPPQIMASAPRHGYTETDPEQLIFETRIMKLEMTLFRRNKLIEILTDRVKAIIPGFSLTSDPELAAYVDDELDQEMSRFEVISQESSEAQLTY